MSHAGDAAEQMVRMSLQGVDYAVRITGTAAKEIFLLLMAALKEPEKGCKTKLKGKERLSSMLKSGKPLEIFSVKEGDLKTFSQAAKQYGIVYCVLRNTTNCPDGLVDVMVKADDAPKISRIIERFNFATVDKARIESEIVADRADRAAGTRAGDEPGVPDINDTDKLVDDLMGATVVPEGRAEPDSPEPEKAEQERTEPNKAEPVKPGKEQPGSRPLADGDPPRSHPSEPISENRKKPERATSSKPSVKEELREIKASKKAKEADAPKRNERPAPDKSKNAPTATTHKQPQRGKSRKTKGSR